MIKWTRLVEPLRVRPLRTHNSTLLGLKRGFSCLLPVKTGKVSDDFQTPSLPTWVTCIVEIASVVFTVVKPRQFFRFGLESWVQVNRNFRSKSTGVELSYKVVSGLIRRVITCLRKL